MLAIVLSRGCEGGGGEGGEAGEGDGEGGSEPFHALVFNLCTVYELCTERNRERKVGLAGKIAGKMGGGGREMRNEDFKL